jgi:hypothetical protein
MCSYWFILIFQDGQLVQDQKKYSLLEEIQIQILHLNGSDQTTLDILDELKSTIDMLSSDAP